MPSAFGTKKHAESLAVCRNTLWRACDYEIPPSSCCKLVSIIKDFQIVGEVAPKSSSGFAFISFWCYLYINTVHQPLEQPFTVGFLEISTIMLLPALPPRPLQLLRGASSGALMCCINGTASHIVQKPPHPLTTSTLRGMHPLTTDHPPGTVQCPHRPSRTSSIHHHHRRTSPGIVCSFPNFNKPLDFDATLLWGDSVMICATELASNRIPLEEAGLLSGIMLGIWATVGILKGDYSNDRREPTVFFNVLLLDAMTSSMMTWVRDSILV